MKKHKILYTSDIHGNEVQYSKLIQYAIKVSADSIIIGGDIAPKGGAIEDYIEYQRNFLEYRLPEMLQPLKKYLPNSNLFLMMGNDDCAANMDVLENSKLFKVIHNKRIKLTEDFEIVGYSFVPITPFGIKDWEKYDLSKVPATLKKKYAERKLTNYRLNGIKSIKTRWKIFQFDSGMEVQDSIQKDLSRKIFSKNPKKTVYIIHSPPDNTKLDIVSNRNHVGSMAVRLFIEKEQPYLTLHGHIHETVDISGTFKHNIKNTLCLTSGNHNVGEQLAVLVFDLYNPQDVRRIII
ncbi:MAG: metallophosphoesterase [Nanoarchaeota archaeon]|nr:metallophosphoesterase [Nanoarchaeota archaeon]MBU1444995.1 metallophosphoesterase [Nanoarchaeota archaeon]MBU2420705.1 metallophosphoesterase [Nanoarchaeota archaeon]MBU2475537.1 metallophosphoesterase [Nanoarchaeota archaeon]